MSIGPNPLHAAWNMLYARRLRRPRPSGHDELDHAPLAEILGQMRKHGVRSLADAGTHLADYRDALAAIDPDTLNPRESLAYWINLYNAGALHRAGQAYSHDYDSVLRVSGAFSAPWATVAGETMSLDDIEHGKIRRFGDPRIHGALVCGSVSCPTLRSEPFDGPRLDEQLDDQMRFFLSNGGGRLEKSNNTLHLTRVLKWYGGDFVRPHKMPTLRPARVPELAAAISQWFDTDDAAHVTTHKPKVVFTPYDWGLGCSVA
ncbi:MAG: DUF547 domain-containing protein [Acidimicrobiia bacterium]|nr:MAG: DUF547 domain-containing protein [Acidimicrobiia bacterium]